MVCKDLEGATVRQLDDGWFEASSHGSGPWFQWRLWCMGGPEALQRLLLWLSVCLVMSTLCAESQKRKLVGGSVGNVYVGFGMDTCKPRGWSISSDRVEEVQRYLDT